MPQHSHIYPRPLSSRSVQRPPGTGRVPESSEMSSIHIPTSWLGTGKHHRIVSSVGQPTMEQRSMRLNPYIKGSVGETKSEPQEDHRFRVYVNRAACLCTKQRSAYSRRRLT